VYNVAHAACCRDTGIGLGFVHLWVYKLVGLHAVGLGACDVDSVRVVLTPPAIEILVSKKFRHKKTARRRFGGGASLPLLGLLSD